MGKIGPNGSASLWTGGWITCKTTRTTTSQDSRRSVNKDQIWCHRTNDIEWTFFTSLITGCLHYPRCNSGMCHVTVSSLLSHTPRIFLSSSLLKPVAFCPRLTPTPVTSLEAVYQTSLTLRYFDEAGRGFPFRGALRGMATHQQGHAPGSIQQQQQQQQHRSVFGISRSGTTFKKIQLNKPQEREFKERLFFKI